VTRSAAKSSGAGAYAASVRTPAAPLVRCAGVGVTLGSHDTRVTVLDGIDLTIAPGSSTVLLGRSGSGKTTLIQVLGGLLDPTGGTVEFDGAPLRASTPGDRLRPLGIANVFQSPNLLPNLTAFENLAFAARNADGGRLWPELGPLGYLHVVGLADKADNLPAELSGGEAQRVAVAGARAQRPRLLLCDEPTGHLDSDTGGRVLELIEALQREFGFALVLATHDTDVASRFPREVELLDGRILRDEVHA
jgi:putative ABC transport system ATP-binding protein